MSHPTYREWNPKPDTVLLIERANAVIEEFGAQGFNLTLRQLYYQFVGNGWFEENTLRQYKNFGDKMTRARYAGMVNWESIEDRVRKVQDYWFLEDERELVEGLSRRIRFDQWDRQENYVEVWVEKDALSDVVAKACEPWLVPYLACKGYISSSEAWAASQRFERKLRDGKNCTIIHLGDHDPSGIQMTVDNRNRVNEFTEFDLCQAVEVQRIALTIDQVREYDLPPNFAKQTDSRYASYEEEFGTDSWELDALKPRVMVGMIQRAIEPLIDSEVWDDVHNQEQAVEDLLDRLGDRWDDIKDDL